MSIPPYSSYQTTPNNTLSRRSELGLLSYVINYVPNCQKKETIGGWLQRSVKFRVQNAKRTQNSQHFGLGVGRQRRSKAAMAAGLAIGLTAVRPQALGTKILNCQKTKWVFSPLAFSSSSSNSRKLILYSKPGCCLCDGLKEKLNAAFSLSTSHSLHDVQLQVQLSLLNF